MIGAKCRFFLILALLLGLFPAKGIWTGKSVHAFAFKKCSIQFLYSITTSLIRSACNTLNLEFLSKCLIGLGRNKIFYMTDFYAFSAGILLTFCLGSFYQSIALCRTSRFIQVLQKLEAYDQLYPATVKHRRLACFFIQNLLFVLITVSIPLSIVSGVLLFAKNISAFDKFSDVIEDKQFAREHPWLVVLIFTLTSFTVETSTIFPIIQLAYLIQSMENRLKEIYHTILEHTTTMERSEEPQSQKEINLLLKYYNKGQLWADKKVFGLSKELIIPSGAAPPFWRAITTRFLDFEELFQDFAHFAGLYFFLIYPVQIMSCIFMIYMWSADVLRQTDADDSDGFTSLAMYVITGLGVWRVWSLSNAGYGMKQIHGSILSRLLRVDKDTIVSQSEKEQYQKFMDVVRTTRIQLNASGYFSISRSNIPSILTALVSYIIILLQFKGSEKSPIDISHLKNRSRDGNSSVTF